MMCSNNECRGDDGLTPPALRDIADLLDQAGACCRKAFPREAGERTLRRIASDSGTPADLLTTARLVNTLAQHDRGTPDAALEHRLQQAVAAALAGEVDADPTRELLQSVRDLAVRERAHPDSTLEDRLFLATRSIITASSRNAEAPAPVIIASIRPVRWAYSAAAALLLVAGTVLTLQTLRSPPVPRPAPNGEQLARHVDEKIADLFNILDADFAAIDPADGLADPSLGESIDDALNCIECDWFQTSNPWEDDGVTS